MTRALLLLALTAGVATPAAAQQQAPDSATLAAAGRLLTAMRSAETMEQVLTTSLAAQREAPTGLPPVFWDSLQARMRVQLPALVSRLREIYAERFTRQELDELTGIYSTPVGRKLARLNGDLTQAGMAAGQQWSAGIAQQLLGEMQEQGLIPR